MIDVIYFDKKDLHIKWFGRNWLTSDSVNIGAKGNSILKIEDVTQFSLNFMGSQPIISQDIFEEKFSGEISTHFRHIINQHTSRKLYSSIEDMKGVLNDDVSQITQRWGLNLISWNLEWIVPDDIMEYWERTKGLKGDAEKEEMLRQYMLQEIKLDKELSILEKQKNFDREQKLKDLDVFEQFIHSTKGVEQKLELEKLEKLHELGPTTTDSVIEKDALVEISKQSPEAASEAAKAYQYKHKKSYADAQQVHVHHNPYPGNPIIINDNDSDVITCPQCMKRNILSARYCIECGTKLQTREEKRG